MKKLSLVLFMALSPMVAHADDVLDIEPAPKTLKLKKNQKYSLKPVLKPVTSKEKITYKSSSSKVVKVDSKGRITAKKKGTAVITVKAGKKTVKCKVTVK